LLTVSLFKEADMERVKYNYQYKAISLRKHYLRGVHA